MPFTQPISIPMEDPLVHTPNSPICADPTPPPVPSYFIHSFERPFCADARCTCHAQQQEVVRLFVSLIEGRLDLEPAAALLPEYGKEGCA